MNKQRNETTNAFLPKIAVIGITAATQYMKSFIKIGAELLHG